MCNVHESKKTVWFGIILCCHLGGSVYFCYIITYQHDIRYLIIRWKIIQHCETSTIPGRLRSVAVLYQHSCILLPDIPPRNSWKFRHKIENRNKKCIRDSRVLFINVASICNIFRSFHNFIALYLALVLRNFYAYFFSSRLA